MKSSLAKDTFRQVRKSLGRFLSIFLIVALGVGFFAGIKATAPDMKITADKYFDDYRLMDIRLISTVGFNEDDIKEIQKLSEIEGISPGYSVDLLAEYGENSFVVKLLSIPLDKVNTDDKSYINRVKLVEGRFPEKPGEILAEHGNGINPSFPIGSKVKFSSGTDEDIKSFIKRDEYTVVGLVDTPYYLSFERGNTNIGTGKISCFMMLPEEEFELSVYTDVYLTVEEARGIMTYDDEYDDILDPIKEKLKNIGESRAEERYKEIVDEANEKLNKAKDELKESESKLQEELSKAEEKLQNSRRDIENGERELQRREREFNIQIANGENMLKQEESKLENAELEYQKNLALFNEKKAEASKKLEEAELQITNGEKEIEEKEFKLNQLKESLNLMEDATERAKTIELIEYSEQEIAKAKQELEEAKKELEKGKQELIEGENELNAAKKAIDQGRIKINSERQKLKDSKEKALAEFRKARQELIEGREEYEKGYEEYLKSKEDAEKEIEEARNKIAKEEKKLEDIEKPEWYVLKRSETYDYIDYELAADRIDAVSKVFPVFFLAIAILVSLTTMTRMVDEERSYIGTLKALGYSNMAIASKYLIYAALASVSGGIFGLLLGLKILPTVIFNAYRIMYIMPDVIIEFDLTNSTLSLLVAIAATIMATWAACRHELSETPALLLRPKAPKPGKRIFLERITFIWSRLKFTQKVTARNILRYKKRFIMTVLGISGCTALLVTGFGLKDSIMDIVNKQFNEIFKYQMSVELKKGLKIGQTNDSIEYIDEDNGIKDYMLIHEKSIDIGKGKSEQTVQLIVPEDANRIQDFIILKNRLTGNRLLMDDEGVILTEKAAKLIDAEVGDEIYIIDEDNNKLNVKIKGITENYAAHYMYMTSNLYEDVFGEKVEMEKILAHTIDTSKKFEDNLSRELLKLDDISSVTFTTGISDDYEDMLGSLNYVIIVIIIAAGSLAFIVLYNLTNINISERFREIATIKVLGFYDNEVAKYIYRENIILSLLGTILGLVLGIFLHKFVIDTVEIESIMFGREIKNLSFIYSAALTIIFSAFVNFAMYYKLKNIDMVESLKSVD